MATIFPAFADYSENISRKSVCLILDVYDFSDEFQLKSAFFIKFWSLKFRGT
jgi:hypothetical protein